ncbi:hypothetical protein EVAR_103098_1 [Eumeta japonica]|uniref:Uncharacterized protein n=1 Tax=Eumeta variegata TaxID=151549 RepID=A0A4C1WNT8_EUMVA|nr:hypothetical protein EVAR_103098_1 [Eumeta japonica]
MRETRARLDQEESQHPRIHTISQRLRARSMLLAPPQRAQPIAMALLTRCAHRPPWFDVPPHRDSTHCFYRLFCRGFEDVNGGGSPLIL